MTQPARVFISHSSDDKVLAERVVDLLQAAIGVADDQILCTSVEGYGLPGGASIDEHLREEVAGAAAFLGIVSERSLQSTYVLFEFGARWGSGRGLIPLLAPGFPESSLERPLAGLRALHASRTAELDELVKKLAQILDLPVRAGASLFRKYEAITSLDPNSQRATPAAAPARPRQLEVGAQPDGKGTRFRVWAPERTRVDVVVTSDRLGSSSSHSLVRDADGYFSGYVENVTPGDSYKYRLDSGDAFPDPASRYQPQGVHGDSEVVEPDVFQWTDTDWRGIALKDLVIYEAHVGTATREGTFDALITRLGAMRELGITAVMLMAVADFPGNRNWGYDGVNLFAPARAYGGPEALRRLVDAAHARGLGVILDVVFNHLGPDGNYLAQFSESYFSSEHTTPWGPALNYTTTSGQAVRDFIVANARHWAIEYHVDGLRLDAIQAIRDGAMPHIVEEVSTRVRESLTARDRQFLVIAEDETNYPRLVCPTSERGFGLDAIYADDFHHQLHVALTGESEGYYQDYSGTCGDLASTVQRCWWFTGQHSRWRSLVEGRPVNVGHPGAEHLAPEHFIWCIQNHDQVGNRPFGERLNHLLEQLDAYRAASTLLLLSPYTPLVFMGQEWAASTPFHFFTDHNKALGRKVTTGRSNDLRRRFPHVDQTGAPQPQDEVTFRLCKLRWEERGRQPHAGVLQLYTDLLALRREHPALRHRARGSFGATAEGKHGLVLRRQGAGAEEALLVAINLRNDLRLDLRKAPHLLPPHGHAWHRRLDTEIPEYGGRGPVSFDGSLVEMLTPGALVLESRKA